MSPAEVEWKAKAIWSIWRAGDRALKIRSFSAPWSTLTGSVKDTFRKLARSRRIKAVEIAWRSMKRKGRNAQTRSPFREAGLSASRARGCSGSTF